ncbi:hypothetical protein [Okeania sp. SIO2C9]|uniref:hypothetical protein n=1 Tax=Okeania sp. SIO2C9 TaxID=2607791 RepID=UPI0025D38D9E|nr:hypothetical protein [Okeania sp. SIO2C9]
MVVVHSNGRECVGRLEVREMGRLRDGGMGSAGEIKKDISSPLPCRTTSKFTNDNYFRLIRFINGSNLVIFGLISVRLSLEVCRDRSIIFHLTSERKWVVVHSNGREFVGR